MVLLMPACVADPAAGNLSPGNGGVVAMDVPVAITVA
jgi:hypothetical protein